MKEKYVSFEPEYVAEFQCDGTSCEAKCCKGWRISIDAVTARKYRNVKPEKTRKQIISCLKKKKGQKLYEIKLTGEKKCPFLEEDFRCRLQKNYGESFLSATCRTYPRSICMAGDLMERSLTLTCPVAAELVLTRKEPIAFVETALEFEHPISIRFPEPNNQMHLLPKIQYAAISILQERQWSIDQRLAVLGFFMEQAGELGEKSLDDLVQFYASDAILEQTPAMFQAIHFQPDRYLRAMFGLAEALYGEGKNFYGNAFWLEFVTEIFRLRERQERVDFGEIMAVYEEKYPGGRESLMKEYSHVLENYLVNEFFMRLIPFQSKGSFSQNFGKFLLGYKLVEFILIAVRICFGNMMHETALVLAIIDLSEKFDHNPLYRDCLDKEAQKLGNGIVDVMKMLLQT